MIQKAEIQPSYAQQHFLKFAKFVGNLTIFQNLVQIFDNLTKFQKMHAVHEITAGHRSLSGTISCETDRIRFLPVTMTKRFSNFNSIPYTEDRHKLRVASTKCQLLDTMSGTGQIFISGAGYVVNACQNQKVSKKGRLFVFSSYWFRNNKKKYLNDKFSVD